MPFDRRARSVAGKSSRASAADLRHRLAGGVGQRRERLVAGLRRRVVARPLARRDVAAAGAGAAGRARPRLPHKPRAGRDRRAARAPAGSASAASPRGPAPASPGPAARAGCGRNWDRWRRAALRRARPPCRRSRRPARGPGCGRDIALITARRTSSAVGPVRTKSAIELVEPARHRVGVLAGLHVDGDLEHG